MNVKAATMAECSSCAWYNTLGDADRLFVDVKINEQGVNVTRLCVRTHTQGGQSVWVAVVLKRVPLSRPLGHHQGASSACPVSR